MRFVHPLCFRFFQVKNNNATPPSIEDVIAMIQEDVFGAQGGPSSEGSARVRSRRSLRSHHLPHTRSSRHQRDRALRAHHLPHTRFTRPRDLRSRRLESADLVEDLIDSLSVDGGFDGSMLFVRLSLDVSKDVLDGIQDLLLSPLGRISEVDFLTDVFSSGDNTSTPFGDTISVDGAFSAGAHLTVLVGFEISGIDLASVASLNASEIASKAFIQFEDVSAKFAASAQVSGYLDLAGISTLSLTDGSIAFAFGIGIEEASPRIYFPNIASTLLSLRQDASWQKVGAVDISLPIEFDLQIGLPSLNPILSITDGNLFDTEKASVSLDFDIR